MGIRNVDGGAAGSVCCVSAVRTTCTKWRTLLPPFHASSKSKVVVAEALNPRKAPSKAMIGRGQRRFPVDPCLSISVHPLDFTTTSFPLTNHRYPTPGLKEVKNGATDGFNANALVKKDLI